MAPPVNSNPFHGSSDLSGKWRDQRFDYTSGNLDYLGRSLRLKASTSAGNLWWIWKYTYAGGNLTRIEGYRTGNWDDRASLDWA